MTIVALRARDAAGRRIRLVAGDGRVAVITAETATRHRLCVGTTMDEETFSALLEEDRRERCGQAAWRLLERGTFARAQLAARLARTYGEQLATETCMRLERSGFVDDRAAALALAERRTRRDRRGVLAVEAELERSAVARDAAAEALAAIGGAGTQEEAARAALTRWRPGSRKEAPLARARSAAAYLLRRGFGEDIAHRVVAEVLGIPPQGDFP